MKAHLVRAPLNNSFEKRQNMCWASGWFIIYLIRHQMKIHREAALAWSYNWKIQLVSSSDCYLDFFLILNICQEQQRWKQILRRQCCPDIIGPDISNTEENALFVLSPLCDIFLKWWELDDLILSKSPEHWKTRWGDWTI